MEDRRDKREILLSNLFSGAKGATFMAGVALVGSLGLGVVNGLQSSREFDDAEAQVRMLVEQGDLTNPKTGAPTVKVMERGNNKFAYTVTSALQTFNSNASAATGGQPGQQAAAIMQQYGATNYEIKGQIQRVEPASGFGRIFWKYGGEREFNLTWTGGKPEKAPLSTPAQITPPGIQYQGVAPGQMNGAYITPPPVAAPAAR